MTAPELGRFYYQSMLKERRFEGWDSDPAKRAPVYKFPKCAFGLSVTKIAERQEWLSKKQHEADRAVTALESIDNKAYLDLVKDSFEDPAPGAPKKRKVQANMVPDGDVAAPSGNGHTRACRPTSCRQRFEPRAQGWAHRTRFRTAAATRGVLNLQLSSQRLHERASCAHGSSERRRAQ